MHSKKTSKIKTIPLLIHVDHTNIKLYIYEKKAQSCLSLIARIEYWNKSI